MPFGRGRRGPGLRRGPAARPAARRQMQRNVRRQRRRRRRRRMLVGGAVVVGAGALAYKLGKSQTQQIEQQYGRSVEEMSDEELEQAVHELNLRKEPLDANDQAYLDQYDDETEAEPAPDYLDELERLGKLKDQDLISEEEFAAKKKQLLGL